VAACGCVFLLKDELKKRRDASLRRSSTERLSSKENA
jgi:hypothetical protein